MRIVKQEVTIQSPRCQQNFNLVALADLHIRHNTPFRDLIALHDEIVQIPNKHGVLIAGDIMDNADEAEHPEARRKALQFLQRLAALAPVYLIYGNHDIFGRSPQNKFYRTCKVPTQFRKKVAKIPGVTVLTNNSVTGDGFFVTGLELDNDYYGVRPQHWRMRPEKKGRLVNEVRQIVRQTKLPDLPRIFLFHSPTYGDILKQELTDYDLILTGHMHNGCMPELLLEKFGMRGLVSPHKKLFPRYAKGRSGNLVILPPVITLPNTLHSFNKLYPCYYTVLKICPE